MAKKVKEEFDKAIDLNIYTNDSAEALNYRIKSASTVLVNGEPVPIDTAISQKNMVEFLRNRM